MRIIFIAGLICVWGGTAPAQSSHMLQSERLNPITCMLAVQNLDPIFRSNLELKCVALAADVCVRREAGPECVQDTQGFLDAFYARARPALPANITGTSIAERSYALSLERIDRVFATPAACDDGTKMAIALCEYTARATSTIDLISRVRQAGIDPKSFAK